MKFELEAIFKNKYTTHAQIVKSYQAKLLRAPHCNHGRHPGCKKCLPKSSFIKTKWGEYPSGT